MALTSCEKLSEVARKVNKNRFRGGKDLVSSRAVLWLLVFFGFAVNYMIRINLNIGIVSMVQQQGTAEKRQQSECIALVNNTTELKNITNTTQSIKIVADEGFSWNEYHQGLVLGGFFWFHWTTQVPGGLLANKYGTKIVFGLSNLCGVLFCFLIPTAAYWGYEWLIAVRVVQGIFAGFAWPAMHSMTARWIPPNERSQFVTAYLGSSVGAGLTFPMCGYIMDMWGWETVFYVCGVLGVTWYVAWYFFVFDSPADHPRIHDSEKEYILSRLGQSVSKDKAPVPWRPLLTSVPVWMSIFAHVGGIYGLFTQMTHAPTYFKQIHGWNIKATGLLSGMPHALRILFAYTFSLVGDHLLTTNKMSRTNVRKLAVSICCIGQGLCMMSLAYSGCNHVMAIFFLTAATTLHGSVSTGPLASFVDLSPNYCGVLLGMGNGLAVLSGIISPTIVGILTYQNQTVGQWQKVFTISSTILLVVGVLYILFAKAEEQPWNNPNCHKSQDVVLESELITLKKCEEKEEKNKKNYCKQPHDLN